MRDLVRYFFGFVVCGVILAGVTFWQNWHTTHPHPVHAAALMADDASPV